MNKPHRLIKKLVALAVVLLLSINSFAAVVGDNDGAAFITKAEFESLKNDFQTQINRYNTSLDNKIDGAIASYVEGIRVEKQTNQSCLCYDESGIIGIIANDDRLKWKEGNIQVNLRLFQQFNQTEWGIQHAQATFNGRAATEFHEASVINLDRINHRAIWDGLKYTKYILSGYGTDLNGGYWNNNGLTVTNYIEIPSFWKRSNVDFTTKADDVLRSNFSNAAGDRKNYIIPKWNVTSINRNVILSTSSNICCSPGSIQYKRFVDYDKYLDFQNDTDLTHHTLTNAASDIWASATKYNSEYSLKDSAWWSQNYQSISADFDSPTGYRTTPTTDIQSHKPFFGFVSALTDWNQIATSNYDSIVANVQAYDNTLQCYTDSNNKKHLFIVAGLPIVEGKNEDTVEIALEFADKTCDYDVWFKMNGWNPGQNIEIADTINRNSIFTDKNCTINASAGTYGSKSVKIKNGKGIIYVQLPKDGYLFLKWSIAGNSGAGGGTFLPPSKVLVIS